MELVPGLHRVEAPLGERYVALYLVIGTRAALLVDTGIAGSVQDCLLPYLDAKGIDSAVVRYVVSTHGDFDHVGGNLEARQAFPHAVFLCGEADRSLVSDVEAMIVDRYGEFGKDHGHHDSDETKEFIRGATRTTAVDIGLRGGEVIDLGERLVEIVHTPGHSWGHLSVLDVQTQALMIGDAVLWNGLLTAEGAPAFPPTYRDVEPYRDTIARIMALQPQLLLTSHYPVYAGQQVNDFLDESLAYSEHVETVLVKMLTEHPSPLSLLALVERSRQALGSWDESSGALLVYPLLGTLERLEKRGDVVRTPASDDAPAAFAIAR